VNEDVYAADTNVDIYVVPDQDWNDGNPIAADVTGSVETISVVNGDIVSVLVWHSPPVPGRYDIVIDANQNRVYDASTNGLDSGSPGFVVIDITISTRSHTRPDWDHRSRWLAVCCWRGQDQKKVQLMHRKDFLLTH
jgi:hypothetical protein